MDRARAEARSGNCSAKILREQARLVQKKRRTRTCSITGTPRHGRSCSVRRYVLCGRRASRPHSGHGAVRRRATKDTQICSAIQVRDVTRKGRSSGNECRKRERCKGNSNEDNSETMADPYSVRHSTYQLADQRERVRPHMIGYSCDFGQVMALKPDKLWGLRRKWGTRSIGTGCTRKEAIRNGISRG